MRGLVKGLTGEDGAGIDSFMKKTHTWLVANWKMNGDAARTRAYAYAVNAALADAPPALTAVFCPPVPYLAAAAHALPANAALMLGAQNCHHEAKGAFTGAVSAPMLADMGCRYVIVGHSEQRAEGLNDDGVVARAEAAFAAGLIPIICIGESLAAYEQNHTTEMLDDQLGFLMKLRSSAFLVAYEPVWAIGSGKTPVMAEIQAVHSQIKSTLGSATSVLYGGSVNAGNIREILAIPQVSGALIGGASLEIESMVAMIGAAIAKGE